MKRYLFFPFALLLVVSARAEQLWPEKDYAFVVAYCYDHTAEPGGRLIVPKKGKDRHSKGVISAMTVRLNRKQVEELRPLLVTPPKGEVMVADCFDPHHAFVFYDKDWKVKAHVSLCFSCGNFEAVPRSLPKSLDMKKLEAFVRKIGLPVFGKMGNYEKLFDRLEGGRPKVNDAFE